MNLKSALFLGYPISLMSCRYLSPLITPRSSVLMGHRPRRLWHSLLRKRPTPITPCPRQTSAFPNLRIISVQSPLLRIRHRIQLALDPRTYALESCALALNCVCTIVAQLGGCLALTWMTEAGVHIGGCTAGNGG
jgi:hypothetical protein